MLVVIVSIWRSSTLLHSVAMWLSTWWLVLLIFGRQLSISLCITSCIIHDRSDISRSLSLFLRLVTWGTHLWSLGLALLQLYLLSCCQKFILEFANLLRALDIFFSVVLDQLIKSLQFILVLLSFASFGCSLYRFGRCFCLYWSNLEILVTNRFEWFHRFWWFLVLRKGIVWAMHGLVSCTFFRTTCYVVMLLNVIVLILWTEKILIIFGCILFLLGFISREHGWLIIYLLSFLFSNWRAILYLDVSILLTIVERVDLTLYFFSIVIFIRHKLVLLFVLLLLSIILMISGRLDRYWSRLRIFSDIRVLLQVDWGHESHAASQRWSRCFRIPHKWITILFIHFWVLLRDHVVLFTLLLQVVKNLNFFILSFHKTF